MPRITVAGGPSTAPASVTTFGPDWTKRTGMTGAQAAARVAAETAAWQAANAVGAVGQDLPYTAAREAQLRATLLLPMPSGPQKRITASDVDAWKTFQTVTLPAARAATAAVSDAIRAQAASYAGAACANSAPLQATPGHPVTQAADPVAGTVYSQA